MHLESILAVIAALPAAYGLVCWVRRDLHARSTARRVKERQPDEWEALPWLVRRHPWAAVEVLVTRGVVSEPEIRKFRARDEFLEKATWVGLLVSALLLLVILAGKLVAALIR